MTSMSHRLWIAGAAIGACCICWLAGPVAPACAESPDDAAHPPLKVEGGFDNAMVHGIRIEDAAGAVPTVVIGGAVKRLVHQRIPFRHQHKYFHFHFRLTGINGRRIRFRYGPFEGHNPHVTALKTPVAYYSTERPRRYELIQDVTAGRVFVGDDEADPDDRAYQGVELRFEHRFRADSAYVCQTFPFTNDDLKDLATEATGYKVGKVVTLGASPLEQLPLQHVMANDPTVCDCVKRGIWMHAGEDPWEFPGPIACAGAARWAMSRDPVAETFRRKFMLHVVPVVQPDALHRGWTNYSPDESYTEFLNFGWSYDRNDIPEHKMITGVLRSLRRSSQPLEYAESLHSSLSWTSFTRFQWGDEQTSKRLVQDYLNARYIPWNTWDSVNANDANKRRFGKMADNSLIRYMKGYYPNVLYHVSHVEAILFPLSRLPGFDLPKMPEWNAEWGEAEARTMRRLMLPHQVEDIERMGVYRLLAIMDSYGYDTEAARAAPHLACGHVDGYATTPGGTRAFRVLYRDLKGREPNRVTLHLTDGTSHEMARTQGTSPLAGMLFEVAVPVEGDATFDYYFTASNGEAVARYPERGAWLGPYAVTGN